MMTTLTLALLAGMVLGVFFFAGLWWTVRKGISWIAPGGVKGFGWLWRLIRMMPAAACRAQSDWRAVQRPAATHRR